MTVDRVRRRERTMYCIAVYLFAALWMDGVYELHLLVGGRRFTQLELFSTFVFFAAWLPFLPFVVSLAHRFVPIPGRRLRALEVHFFSALLLSFLTLVAHKLVFCGGHSYLDCLTYYRPESWLLRWFALDYFVYAGVVSAVWISILAERKRLRDLEAAALERELASAEVHLMSSWINPPSLIAMFASISALVTSDSARAERLIARVADFLRLQLRAVGEERSAAGNDELVNAWDAVRREAGDGSVDPPSVTPVTAASSPVLPPPMAVPGLDGREGWIAVAAVAGAYAIAVAFLLVEYDAAFRVLGPALLRSALIRGAFWVTLLPLTFLATRAVLRRTRNVIAQAAVLTAMCIAAAALAEGSFLLFAVGHGWFRRPFDREQETLATLLPTLLATLHAPFTFLLGMTMGTRWLTVSTRQELEESRLHRLEARLSEARARLLRSQVHPHFLFNSLNSVAALVAGEPGKAAEMLQRLSAFYAIALATEGRHTVTLGEELGYVRQYVDIEQIRFGPRLRTDIGVPAELLSAEVPTLILQPLAENAIKHGISNRRGPGTIAVHANREREGLVITVEDSGVLDGPHHGNGIGLANTRQRLRQMYGSRASVSIAPIATGTRVTLVIPAP